jgi:hypothetical protein
VGAETRMADIFISYSRKDHDIARGLADFLDSCGYQVWWDPELVGGEKFRSRIKEELTKAKAAIVIWTPNSVEADFVIEEAEEAKQSRKLIATRVDALAIGDIPYGFRNVHTDVVTVPERILRALDKMGVSPLRPPKTPKVERFGNLDADAIAKAEQFAHWEFIKDSNDPAVFARYVKMFPTSSFTALARSRLSELATEAWQKLGASEETQALQKFVQLFGDDPCAVEAQGRIDALEARAAEAESWVRVKDSADLAAVDAHVARFPSGVNAAAASALLQQLQRERDAAERWHTIAAVSEPEAFEQFLATYPDSAFAEQARAQLDEIHRVREEQDWTAVKDTRHPAPFLRFLRTHPRGVKAAEALELLESLGRTVEHEAWAEVKESDQPILFKAYLAALPHGQNAKAAQAQLRKLGVREAATTTGTATAQAPAAAKRKRDLFISVALMGVLLTPLVTWLGIAEPWSASGILLIAATTLALVVLPLYFYGCSLFPNAMKSADGGSILFHAVGSITILLWIGITQIVAEGPRVPNPNPNAIAFVVVVIAAGVALLVQKSNRWRWLHFAWYGLVPVIGLIYIITQAALYLEGFEGATYIQHWVTTCVHVYGGTLLVLLSAAVILSRTGLLTRLDSRNSERELQAK